ncbi:MAG: MarR family transcriptional regulator [Treponema sp.]|jgi:DNA-binding MarR family transcriptional regulator|nr:MarR family transcriptional regulator [Treponema sp.]
MVNTELIQNLIKNLSKLERRQKHFMNRALASTGLHGIMYKYIITLEKHPGVSQDFLAEFHSVDKSRVARVVRELEKMAYISRSPDEKDRRYYRLCLTGEGMRLAGKIQEALMEWGKGISENISPADIQVTLDTVGKMISNAAGSRQCC